MSHEHHTEQKPTGVWYTYFGKGGAAVVAFLWIIMLITWIFSVINWG